MQANGSRNVAMFFFYVKIYGERKVKPDGALGVVLANTYELYATTLLGVLWPNISSQRVTVFLISRLCNGTNTQRKPDGLNIDFSLNYDVMHVRAFEMRILTVFFHTERLYSRNPDVCFFFFFFFLSFVTPRYFL